MEKASADIQYRNRHWNARPFRIDNTSGQEPVPKIPQGPMFHGDSISDQVKESENTTISCSKQHFNHQIQESVKEKAPKLPQRPMFYDDSNLDNNENENENENAIYVISGNDYHHPFSPQIQESNL